MKLTQAQIDHLKWLEDGDGRLTPDRVLDDARRDDSPLHALFEWDVDKAAHMAWLDQAREIIRAVKIVVTNETYEIKANAYVRDPDVTGQGYRSTIALQREPESARQALADELTRAAGVLLRARNLAVALSMEDHVDAMLMQLTGLQSRVTDSSGQHALAS